MSKCLKCQSHERQVKLSFIASGSQRCLYRQCGKSYVAEPKVPGHSEESRRQALSWYSEGGSLRAIGRQLGISPQSVGN